MKPTSDSDEAVTATLPLTGTAFSAGARIQDRYRIEKELGRGGMGVVYLACDEELSGRRVVIKILQDRPHRNDWLREKFGQERAALATLNYPGIVGVFDAGTLADGRPFIVMQYVGGVNLRQEMNSQPMPLARVAEILRQIGSALAVAHSHGICHRDIKPENIMVEQVGPDETIVRIIDFGLAALRGADQPIAQTAVVAGSFPYIAPEQVMGRAGPAADIYALAITAWEMLAGAPPPGPLRASRPEIPARAEALLLNALSLDPTVRAQNAKEFTTQLAEALCSTAGAGAESESIANPLLRPKSSAVPRRWWAAGAFVTMLTVAAAGLFLTRPNKPGESREFTYSFRVRGSDGTPRPLAKEAVLPPGYGLKLVVRSPADGFLYVVNEGPATAEGQLWTWLFPQPGFQNGSGAIRANQVVTIPPAEFQYLVLDKRLGTERVYVLWAELPIPELDVIRAFVFSPGLRGDLSASQAQTVHNVIEQNLHQTQIHTDADGTTVRGAGPVIVKLIALEHM